MDTAARSPYMQGAMNPRLQSYATTLALLLLPALAVSQEQQSRRPLTLPSRDVAVTYEVSGMAADALPGGAPGVLRLAWDAGGRRLHVGADARSQAAIVNLTEGKAVILDEGSHAAITLPLGARAMDSIALSGARFQRGGTERVAGHDCTDYAVQDPRGSGTLCLTADGVPLRGDGTWGGQAGRFVATRVKYGAQPDSLFHPPPGFMQLSLPKNLGTMGIAR